MHISGVARRLTQSHGSYTTWAKRRAEQQKALKRSQQLRQQEIDKLQEYVIEEKRRGEENLLCVVLCDVACVCVCVLCVMCYVLCVRGAAY